MLTAKEARELANDFERRRQAENYIRDHILPQIEKQALKGNTELIFEICNKPGLQSFIVSELENLGYYVKKSDSHNFDLCISYLIGW